MPIDCHAVGGSNKTSLAKSFIAIVSGGLAEATVPTRARRDSRSPAIGRQAAREQVDLEGFFGPYNYLRSVVGLTSFQGVDLSTILVRQFLTRLYFVLLMGSSQFGLLTDLLRRHRNRVASTRLGGPHTTPSAF